MVGCGGGLSFDWPLDPEHFVAEYREPGKPHYHLDEAGVFLWGIGKVKPESKANPQWHTGLSANRLDLRDVPPGRRRGGDPPRRKGFRAGSRRPGPPETCG